MSDAVTVPFLIDAASRRMPSQFARITVVLIGPPMRDARPG